MKTTIILPALLILMCAGLGSLDGSGVEAAEAVPQPTPADSPSARLAERIVRSAGIHVGLCVHLGVTDGRLDVALAKRGRFIVHGLASTPERAKEARTFIHSHGLYGTVSVGRGSLSRLPYVANLVNLVVADDLDDAVESGLSLVEVLRVLRPGGVAYLGEQEKTALRNRLNDSGVQGFEVVREDGLPAVVRKVRPPAMDDWTHWLHDPAATNLSLDGVVAPAVRLQWQNGPDWLTAGHVTELFANGRSFNVMGVRRGRDDRSCVLIARDAYNGIVLWQRELAADRQRYSPRVVVAVGDRVFAVIRAKEGTPLVALDAANGQEVKTYDVGISPLSVLYLGGNLILAAEKEICSVNAETGKVNWRTAAPKNTTYRFQAALDYGQYPHVVSGDGRLFVFVKDAAAPPYSLVCYDAATGGELWRKRYPGELLKYYEGVLALLDQPIKFSYKKATRGTIHGISTRDGRSLWVRGNVEPLHSDAAVFCSAGLLWVNDAGIGLVGLDPATGSERKQLKTRMTGHCGYVRTTEQYFIGVFSRFVSNETGESFDAGCYKNACGVGQVPANGLVYTFPIACSCCPYLRGFLAFAPTDEAPKGVERPGTLRELLGVTPAPAEGADDTATKEPDRLEKGRAYGVQPKPEAADAGTEWATFRHDNRRSGSTAGTLSPEMKLLWSRSVTDQERTPYGRSMTPPVVAEGAVFVAAPDAHHVCALDAATGRVRWRYLLDGRVEAPPTVYCGLCLFGANDGWVYCLRANDGELVWRFRAAPQEHRFMACDRLESPWPVPGVLVEQGVAYFAAGRHARSHDGIALYALDPFTGKMLWRKSLRKVRSWTGGFMVNDLLVSNGKSVFMSIWRYDPKTGEQNGNWKDEKYLRSGSGRYGGGCAVLPFGLLYDRKEGPALTFPWPYQGVHGSHGPWSQPTYWHYRGVEGLLLVFTDERVFGVVPEKPRGQVPWQIFAKRPDDSIRPVGDEGGKQPKSAFAPVWSVTVRPKSVQALLSAGPTLFAAGSGNDPTRGALWAYSARDGKRLGELRFGDVPVFDGLAAAHGRLYVSSEGGKVFCFGGKQVLTAE